MTPPAAPLPTPEETAAFVKRRQDFFRRLQEDADWQLFFQHGVLDAMVEKCESRLKNPAVKGGDLELERNKWLWCLELRDLVAAEVATADRLRAEAAAEREEIKNAPPRGSKAEF